jgi:multiple sugar transport system permease protein
MRLKHFLIKIVGKKFSEGILYKIIIYALLFSIGFVFLYPIFIMISNSFKSLQDLLNPMVNWIPTSLHYENYTRALKVLNMPWSFFSTFGIIALFTIAQTFSTALVGYGLAKFDFPLKRLFFAFIVASFIIPPQVTMIPQYLLFKNYGMLGSVMPHTLLAVTGQGIKSAIFILIFYQTFRMIPRALDEAAQIDGAGRIKLFFHINLRLAVPAIVVVAVFSFVWYWNETYLSSLYFGNVIKTLPLQLQRFVESYSQIYKNVGAVVKPDLLINEGIRLSGTLITILPLIIMYVIFERKLVESIDKAGITGE